MGSTGSSTEIDSDACTVAAVVVPAVKLPSFENVTTYFDSGIIRLRPAPVSVGIVHLNVSCPTPDGNILAEPCVIDGLPGPPQALSCTDSDHSPFPALVRAATRNLNTIPRNSPATATVGASLPDSFSADIALKDSPSH